MEESKQEMRQEGGKFNNYKPITNKQDEKEQITSQQRKIQTNYLLNSKKKKDIQHDGSRNLENHSHII